MPAISTTGDSLQTLDICAKPYDYLRQGGPLKGNIRNTSCAVLGSAVAFLMSAQGAFAALPEQIQTNASGSSQEEISLPDVTVTSRMVTATTQGIELPAGTRITRWKSPDKQLLNLEKVSMSLRYAPLKTWQRTTQTRSPCSG